MGSQERLNVVLTVESVRKLPSGGIELYVRNIGRGSTVVTMLYMYDADENVLLSTIPTKLKLDSGDVKAVRIPALKLSRTTASKTTHRIKIVLGSKAGFFSATFKPSSFVHVAKKLPTLLGFKAFRSKHNASQFHWVVIDFNTGSYLLYEGSGSYPGEPYRGRAPLLENINDYTITENWVPWSKRPVDSPVVIVVNPKLGHEDWVFTWHDPAGTWRLYVGKLNGDIESDFLCFWEDLFNPFIPPSRVDDWRDNVFRVTVFANGTYRLAVYMAKGGYKHQFYLNIRNANPLLADTVYVKPFDTYWTNCHGGLCYEIPDKVFYTHLS